MKRKRVLFMFMALLTVYPAQAINFSGVVKNSAGRGLEGVRVRLGKGAITTTTGPDGSFSLVDVTGLKHQPHRRVFSGELPFRLEGNTLFINGGEQSRTTVRVYDCKGGLVACATAPAPPGSGGSMRLLPAAAGIHIYRISIGNNDYTFRRVVGITASHAMPSSPATISPADLSKKAAARIDDALLFIKEGYQLYRIAVTKPESSGLQITMTPLDTGTMTDVEGNVYKTVRIGNQYWTAENLRTTKYNDGSSIGSACYFYKNTTDAAAKKKWGALYTEAAANSAKLAPAGWRVPTNADWDTLINFLISRGYNYDGTTKGDFTAKALAAQTDWPASTDSGAIGNDLSLNNASGFSALPAGWKFFDFEEQGTGAYWWIAGKGSVNVLTVWWIFRSVYRYSTINFGASIRLVRHI